MTTTSQNLDKIDLSSESAVTIKGDSRRAKKSRKVLMMMMKAAKLGWAGPGAGQEQSRSRPGVKQERGRSKSRAGAE